MATMAVIDGTNTVVNIILADPSFTMPGFTLVQSDVAAIGDTYTGGQFIPPAPKPPPIPQDVPGWKGQIAMVKSVLPDGRTYDAAARALFASMGEQGKILLIGYENADFERADPTLNALLSGKPPMGLGLTSDQIDALFIMANAVSL